jgi:hypothetical protein
MIEKRIDFESANFPSLSLEVLDNLLLSESISIGSEDAFLRFILKLGPGYRDLLRHVQIVFLSEDGLSLLEEHSEIPPEPLWQCAAEWITRPQPPLLVSQIISEFPDIFAEFKGKHFELLWRGSRDGFQKEEFHRRCDGHANTLTVILDTKGNIFGGFTPLEWESRTSWPYFKADDSLKSFLFTLKTPHNIPSSRFALKAEMKHKAIGCYSGCGPWFGDYDIVVSDNCDANTGSFTSLGYTYTNDTGLLEFIVFAGSKNFQVKEIEVFEITD